MTLVVPRYRTYSDTDSIPDALAIALLDIVQPEVGRFWSLIPWASPVSRLDYTMASRTRTARQVVLGALYDVSEDSQVTLDATTRTRVTDGHILYHPVTKTRLVLDEVNTTTGVCTIRKAQYAPGGSATDIASGQTLYVIGQSEHYDEINAESRAEETDYTTNYIQDTTELLNWSIADLRERRKWGVDKRLRLEERMEDIMRDLNLGIIFNVPCNETSTDSAVTAGFDYLVENAGKTVNAAASGTADIMDLVATARDLEADGVGSNAGLVMVANPDTYYEYEDQGLQDFTSTLSPEEKVFVGNSILGITVGSIGRIPFYTDSSIPDNDVRFVATRYASKSPYQGEGEQTILENLRVVPEPSLGNSKVEISSIQMKWGTHFRNADKVNRKLITGL